MKVTIIPIVIGAFGTKDWFSDGNRGNEWSSRDHLAVIGQNS